MNTREALDQWLEHEIYESEQMIRWFTSVAHETHREQAFVQAVELLGHLGACRHNWLDRLTGGRTGQIAWWPNGQTVNQAAASLTTSLDDWTGFLLTRDEHELDQDFTYKSGPDTWRFNVRGICMQLVGHGFYHRGQIALLLRGLGAETSDSDFLYWKLASEPKRWGRVTPDTC